MYRWGYIKNAALAKLDLDDDQEEAVVIGLLNRFSIYANEAMTQICSAVKPKRKYFKINTYEIAQPLGSAVNVDGTIVENASINDDRCIVNSLGEILYYPVHTEITMPEDFISFSDDVSTVEYYDFLHNKWLEECHDDTLEYEGYNKVICKIGGKYKIAYNATWFNFEGITEETLIDAPNDVLDCIPSYIASQCYKVDDEYKSAVFRNEYEMFLARIDNTDFKNTRTIKIEGDW